MGDFISFAEYHIKNTDSNFLEKYWDYKKNKLNPYEISYGTKKKVWIKCQKKKFHNSYEISCNNFSRGYRCSYCNPRNKVHPLDSIGFLYYNIAKMIVEDKRNEITWEDMYKISPNSHKKFYFKCLKCGTYSDKKKSLDNVISHNYFCSSCADGIPITEKFMSNLLNRLNINFISQYRPSWSENKRYDYYILDKNIIIEINGNQHYNETYWGGRTLEEEQENDKYKKELALKNGIENYIVIDCRKTELKWLKEEIEKSLNNIFNLKDVKWTEIWSFSQNSLVSSVWDLWNKGLSISEISKEIGINRNIVTKYLKRGVECAKCNYTKEEAFKRREVK